MDKKIELFHVIDKRGRELTRLNGDVMFYINAPLRELRDPLLSVMNLFYELCPRENLRWYLTETMKQFKPATPKSFTLPAVWWQEGAPRKDLRQLMLKGGEAHDSVPTWGIFFSSAEREAPSFSMIANYLRFSVPAEFLETKYKLFSEFVIAVSNTIPYTCGHAGFVIECNPYDQRDAETAAYPLAMRHQAVDIATRTRGPWAVRNERIKNVGWLTLIGSLLLEKIGGAKTLQSKASERLHVTSTTHGVVIRAGERPILGDVNRQEDLQAYYDAYALVEPLHEGIEELFAPFSMEGDIDEVEATLRWLSRFRR